MATKDANIPENVGSQGDSPNHTRSLYTLRSCNNCAFFTKGRNASFGKCGNHSSPEAGKELFKDSYCEEWRG